MYTHIYLCNRNTQQNFVRISHEHFLHNGNVRL